MDPSDESDDSWIDADDATIWERGESVRRCASSASYVGTEVDVFDDGTIGEASTIDEFVGPAEPLAPVADNVDPADWFFGAINWVIAGVGTTATEGLELTCAFKGCAGIANGGFEAV